MRMHVRIRQTARTQNQTGRKTDVIGQFMLLERTCHALQFAIDSACIFERNQFGLMAFLLVCGGGVLAQIYHVCCQLKCN